MSSREIPLTKGLVALVDEEDYAFVSQWKWLASKGYAARQDYGTGSFVYMHREILGVHAGVQVNHINGDRADNRRCNLRTATRAEYARTSRPRQQGSSRFKGVCWVPSAGRWRTRIRVEGRFISLGMYDDEVEAARVYDAAAQQYFGEFARLNFPAL